MIGDVVELIRAFSRDIQEHSVAIYTLTVVIMLLHHNSLRRKVRGLDDRQEENDKVAAVIQNDQLHMTATLGEIKKTLERHDRDERNFWTEVRRYMNGGNKKEK